MDIFECSNWFVTAQNQNLENHLHPKNFEIRILSISENCCCSLFKLIVLVLSNVVGC